MAFLDLYRWLISAPLLLAGIVLFAAQAGATAITIQNFSFETPGATNSPNPGCPNQWACIPSGSSFNGGVYTPTSAQYAPGADGLTGSRIVPDGNQAGFISTGQTLQTLTQTTSATFVTGQKYTLSVYAGFRADQGTTWGNAMIELLGLGAGGAGFVQQSVSSPGQGNWAQTILTYTAVAADNGNTIRVGLLGSTSDVQINWDNVRLTVPEPSTLLLLGMGFALVAFGTRRKKNPA